MCGCVIFSQRETIRWLGMSLLYPQWTLGRYKARLPIKYGGCSCHAETRGKTGDYLPALPQSFHRTLYSHFTLLPEKVTPGARQVQIRERVSSQILSVYGTSSPFLQRVRWSWGRVLRLPIGSTRRVSSTPAIPAEHRIGFWDREISHHPPLGSSWSTKSVRDS